MARRSGLGKGLQALIPGEVHDTVEHELGDVDGARLVEVPVEAIRPNPFQPRRQFDDDSLAELTASITEVGVLQPILVRTVGGVTDAFELIAGERRWRAARRAGLEVVPAIVQDHASDLHSLEIALIENLHRSDLNALEEAAAYQQLIDEFDLTHEQVAERVTKSRTSITNTLRLLALPPGVQRALVEGRISAGHAKALLAIEDHATLEATAAKVEVEGLSVRATEELVRRMVAPQPPAPTAADELAAPKDQAMPDAGISELEHLLERHLDTRVKVDLKGRRGRVIVEFADLDDLERIYRAVTGVPSS
ncbi:MAG TPA: ParB/RepB/Spo0J family partition protein [Acidimicrobiales bacterium]|jgi:ParB family chromosome partitioning protein|nr:ParB/RepB/Spo0J family partition protein [Acidimicrobiales bacterium]